MLHEKQKNRSRRITVGADKAYDTKDFVATARELNVTPHVTNNEKGTPQQPRPKEDKTARLCHQPQWQMLVEKGFGWLKQTGPLRQVKIRGLERWTGCSSSVAPPIT
jgi:hypothetical protein